MTQPNSVSPDRATKNLVALRYSLIMGRYHTAARALEFMLSHHTGLRRDKITPEWMHPVRVTQHVLTVASSLGTPEQQDHALSAALLHDTAEDYRVTLAEIEEAFSSDVGRSVAALSRKLKTDPRAAVDKPTYYARMSSDRFAPLIKAADRGDNLDKMQGVFTREKQLDYLLETTTHILPMMRRHRRLYPELHMINQNFCFVLHAQVNLLRVLLADLIEERGITLNLRGEA